MRFSLLSAAVAVAAAAGYAAAQAAKVEAIPGRYIVEIETPAEAATADIKASADKIDAVLASAGISAKNIQHKYSHVFPGASVRDLSADDVERLSKVGGVKQITQVYRRKLDLPTPLVPAGAAAKAAAVSSSRKVSRAFDGASSPALNASIPEDALAKGTQVTISGADDVHVANHPTAGEISWYASRGLAADLTLKPTIAAPGGAIYSTIPVAKGSYGQLGGTSMAAPYISGLIALYLQRSAGTSPVQIQAALQSGARNVMPHYAQATFPGLDSPASVGAGVVNVTNFLNPAQPIFAPSQLSLNDTGRPDFKGTYVKTLRLFNNAGSPAVFDISHESSIATTFAEDYLNAPLNAQRFANASSSVSFSPSTLSIPANRSATVAVTITPPSNLNDADLFIYGGWIVATPRQPIPNGIAAARLPYAGVKGNYSTAPILTKPPTFTQKFVGNTTDGTPIWDPFQDEFAK
ncbi:hypothetical protein GQ42DRAFT_159004, partial [Ramicandelaber brevisporus]